MDMKEILAGVRQGLETAQKIAGPLAAFGVPYAGVAKSLLDVAENLEKRISDGVIVATAQDREEVQRLIQELQSENDRLNEAIANS